jgi:hypothetical protein
MPRALTITKEVHFRRLKRGRKIIEEGSESNKPELGSIPRLSRLMALAIHMEGLIGRGEVADYADLARLAHVSRARITQIMNLLHLAPDIQEAILFLPSAKSGQVVWTERQLRPVTREASWTKQRKAWNSMTGQQGSGNGSGAQDFRGCAD